MVLRSTAFCGRSAPILATGDCIAAAALIHSTTEGNTMNASAWVVSHGVRIAATAALVFGLGFGAAAVEPDPDCISVCQELLRDCIAQSGSGPTGHCSRAARECRAGCSV